MTTKSILIIYPHWYPANLAGTQRPRLTGNYLEQNDYIPRILTVKSQYFEETPDNDFYKTFSDDFVVTRVDALPVNREQWRNSRQSSQGDNVNPQSPLSTMSTLLTIYRILSLNFRLRLLGDIGLRAFIPLYREALHIIRTEQPAFLWLPIPSFYNALLGRLLHAKTGILYGIDYIDPWVRDISNQKNFRAVLSQWVARILEPIAVKKAALITGVSEEYYLPMMRRNFGYMGDKVNKGDKGPVHVAFPYGFDPNDHKIKINNLNYPWDNISQDSKLKTQNWLYAGAFLPNSHYFLNLFFNALSNLTTQQLNNLQLYFIGTGPYPAKRISQYAADHNISHMVTEIRDRYPFLHVLNFLSAADTVMIIGSTEKHYTASKTYQSILSQRPVFSIFHHESQAVKVMEECNADQYTIKWHPGWTDEQLVSAFEQTILKRLENKPWQPDLSALDKYSANEGANKLANAVNQILKDQNKPPK